MAEPQKTTKPNEQLPPTPVAPIVLESTASFWEQHRLILLLIFTVIIATVFMVVSMILYSASGAAELDLSRPGFQAVSDQVERTDNIKEYSASGAINKETIEEFIVLFDEQADRAQAVDAFKGDPLNPEVLYANPQTGSN